MKSTFLALALGLIFCLTGSAAFGNDQPVPGGAGEVIPPASAPVFARTWQVEGRPATDFPAPRFDAVSGPLKPRPITPRDFYLNLAEVSDHRWIIIKFTEAAMVRWRDHAPWSKSGASLSALRAFLARHPELRFYPENEKLSEDLLDFWEFNGERNTGQDLANLNNFYVLQTGEVADPVALLRDVIAIDIVETAFYAPKTDLACADIAPTTPDFEASQTYTAPAPNGVDAQFAWSYYDSAGRGNTSAWCFDIEWDWTENHEDFPADFSVFGGGDQGVGADHGDAVLGIIAACHNGFGTTGLSSNVHPKAVSWPMQSGSGYDQQWASALNLAASSMAVGESYLIEIQATGPNPGYSCDYGCGNCGQFTSIAIEYWDNTFAAIQTHTANGLIVYEAAGNGQCNLDAAAYGNRFQTSYRNSNAIVVGAADPTTRQAMCWSNYGARVDLFGWGASVWSTGYGNGWSGSTSPDRRQWYTSSFSGTSSATPIVTASGNDLQGIAQRKYGMTFNAVQMHTYLAAGGTPYTGTHDIGALPDLADAINAIEPDVAPRSTAGWYSPFVPRNTTGATTASCGLTPLSGNVNTTYWNVFGHNNGISPAPDAVASSVGCKIFLDGDWNYWMTWGRIGAGSDFAATNQGPVTVRGGRHSFQWYIDDADAFHESNETNNTFTDQLVWSPLQLTAYNAAADRAAPPLKNWGNPSYYNGDGFRGSPPSANAYWTACAVLPQNGNDVDLYSYADSYTAESGFETPQAMSEGGAGVADFILVNGNVVTDGMNRLYQAVRFSDASTANFKIEVDAALTASYYPPYTRTTTIGANEIFDLYEIWLSAGTSYYLGAQNVTGNLDLALQLYGPGGNYYTYSMATWTENQNGSGAGECHYWAPPTSGWYCVAVIKSNFNSYGLTGSYTFTFESPGTANLKPAAGLANWDAPLVARNVADVTIAAAHFPSALQSGATTYLNAVDGNEGTAPTFVYSNTHVWVDDAVAAMLTIVPANPWVHAFATNLNAGAVRGGRHTLKLTSDIYNTIAESNESDNTWSGQYVWSPTLLSTASPAVTTWTLPPVGGSAYPNSVGYQYTPPANYASGAALLPRSVSTDYDLYLYRDYTGATAGFSSLAVLSAFGTAAVDYVLVPWRQTQTQASWYPALVNYSGADSVMIDVKSAAGHDFSGMPWSIPDPDTITASGLFQVYECALQAGQTYRIFLDVLSGTADLEVRLFRDSTAFQNRGSALAAANSGTGDETLIYTSAVTDWYTVVVSKTTSAAWSQSAVYNLRGALHNIPPAMVDDLVIEPQAAGVRLAWNPVTTDLSGNPLVNRRYVIYRSLDLNLVPLDSDSIAGTTSESYTDTAVVPGTRYFYRVKVKAN